MNCPKCGAELNRLEDGAFECPSCNSKFRPKKQETNDTPQEKAATPAATDDAIVATEAAPEEAAQATPETATTEAPAQATTDAAQKFPTSIGDIKRKSKADLKGHYGHSILTMILLNLTTLGSFFVGSIFGPAVVSGATSSSFAAFFVDIANHKVTGVDNSYRGFKRFGAAFAVNLVTLLLLIAVGVVILIPIITRIIISSTVLSSGGSASWIFTIIMVLFALAAIVGLAIIALIRQLSFYVMNDHVGISASNCFKYAGKLLFANFTKIILLNLSFIGWWILTAYTLGGLNIFVSPYYRTCVANLYLSIKDTVKL